MTDYNIFDERPGVATLKYKHSPALERRIDRIVELDRKKHKLIEARDYWGLVELSYEYDALNHMHNTAKQIRIVAAAIERQKNG